MKRDYTGKYMVGQTVYINDKSGWHGQPRTVAAINRNRNGNPYELNDGFYYPESELSAEPLITPPTLPPTPTHTWQTMDIDSGLGIGGINNDQSAPFVPSVAAIERMQRLHDTDTVCRRCGASANFDGAMFTTLGGTNICDDCA